MGHEQNPSNDDEQNTPNQEPEQPPADNTDTPPEHLPVAPSSEERRKAILAHITRAGLNPN